MEVVIISCNASDWLLEYSLSLAERIQRYFYKQTGSDGQYERMKKWKVVGSAVPKTQPKK